MPGPVIITIVAAALIYMGWIVVAIGSPPKLSPREAAQADAARREP